MGSSASQHLKFNSGRQVFSNRTMEATNVAAGAQIRKSDLQQEEENKAPGMVQMKSSGSRHGKFFLFDGASQSQ